jgi:tetratricopeptide (TPR) repeat protein
MERKVKNSMVCKPSPVKVLVISAAILLNYSLLMAKDQKTKLKVNFDISSIGAIVNDPANVLRANEEFWKIDAAYQLSATWHNEANVPRTNVLMDDWRQELKTLAALPLSERQNLPYYKLALEVDSNQGLFREKAIPHLLSFLPNRDGMLIETTVYLTAFTYAYAFSADGQIVINQSSSFWSNNLNKVLGLLAHELFHVGYRANFNYFQEDALDDDSKYQLLIALQNEGTATYIGYAIRDVFPAEVEDLVMMDKPDIVQTKINQVNDIFTQADALEPEEIRKLSWDVGVDDRAYYVTGGHMARTIDQKLGRAALVSTIVKGPLSFVDTYNKLAPKEEQILRFSGPDKNSSILRLKAAALGGDDAAVEQLKLQMAVEYSGKEKILANSLNLLGYNIYFVFTDAEAAIRVLNIATFFNPEAAYIWDTIGEIYFLDEDYRNSEKFYRKALQIDPSYNNPVNMLKKIAAIKG